MKIFITGASSGIGRGAAEILLKSGHEVWGVARRKEELESVQSEFPKNFHFSVCDQSDPNSRQQAFNQMRAAGFIPDAVILNAGIYLPDVNPEFDLSRFEKNFSTNVAGSLFWVEKFLSDFRRRGNGTFIAISSTSAYRPGYSSVGYPASKAALSMAFRGLRLNLKNEGIKFTTLHFGPIRTRMWVGSKSFLIPTVDRASGYLVSLIGKKQGSYFYPWLSTVLFRLSLLLPDRVFSKATKVLKKTEK